MSIRKGNDIIASKPLIDAVPTQDSTNAVSSGGVYTALQTQVPAARLADQTSATQGQVLTLDSNLDAVWANAGGGSLPSQTGNAGKFLTTDGTDASWSALSIPTITYDAGTETLVIA